VHCFTNNFRQGTTSHCNPAIGKFTRKDHSWVANLAFIGEGLHRKGCFHAAELSELATGKGCRDFNLALRRHATHRKRANRSQHRG
jgi:hypothetical protein